MENAKPGIWRQFREGQWSNMINNLFLKGITVVDLVSLFYFPAELEFSLRDLSESLLEMCVCMLTQN